MKPLETILKPGNKYYALALICLIYGGFSLFFFFFQAYSEFWRAEIIPQPSDINFLQDSNSARRFAAGGPGAFQAREPRSLDVFLFSPQNLTYLIGGLVAIVAGIAIFSLIRKQEVKFIKQQTAENLLLPDEKKVISALKQANYELTQAKIVKETGLSKVQVHRAIKRLEAKGIMEKHEYGLTNKIILKKEFL